MDELAKILKQKACAKCGFENKLALQVDHKNGGGNKERKEKFNNNMPKFFKFYLSHPSLARKNLQILCANCNQIKRRT